MINLFVKITTSLLGILILSNDAYAGPDPLEVFVSVLPQKFFVERIAGENANVEVMVGPGQSPETYDPSPKQLTKLSRAKVYFSIGVPFEQVWMPRMNTINDDLLIVDSAAKARSDCYDQNVKDPHIWVSPVKAKLIAEQMLEALIKVDSDHATIYQENFKNLKSDLENLDQEIRTLFELNNNKKTFLVMHPAWGYFAKEYNLEQIAIEHEGKSPSAKSLQKLIQRAEQEKIKLVFIQDQHSSRMADTVAAGIGAKVVRLDPLAENYIENLRKVAAAIAESFK